MVLVCILHGLGTPSYFPAKQSLRVLRGCWRYLLTGRLSLRRRQQKSGQPLSALLLPLAFEALVVNITAFPAD